MLTGRSGRGGTWLAAAWLAVAAQAPAATKAAAKAAARPATSRPHLKAYPSRYYIVYSDLDAETVREAAARMTAMAEEYHRRTRGFAGTIHRRLPFYLFRGAKDYYDAGGMKGSAGIYDAGRQALLALAAQGADERLWHTVQHEGFHQFADMVIGGELPIWINEGMAEYFGHGIWTGDGFVTGVIPPYRLQRVQEHIRGQRVVPFEEMLRMTVQEWGDAVRDAPRHEDDANAVGPGGSARRGDPNAPERPAAGKCTQARVNYDQAWSMVHFLAHAEDGRYRKALVAMIGDVSGGRDWKASFQQRLGRNIEAFEKRYRQWWLAQKPDATQELYTKAVVAILTSFLARAVAGGQKFQDVEDFLRAARDGQLKCPKSQWLPPRLLNDALLYARLWRRGLSLEASGRIPKLVLQWGSQKTFTGSFTCSRGKAENVKVTVTRHEGKPPAAAGR
jgi:hypothetical protein